MPAHDFQAILQIAFELGLNTDIHARFLDFGCGKGSTIGKFHANGYKNVYGCDISIEKSDDNFVHDGIIRRIDTSNYKLPFENESFDCVFSQAVLEHVQDVEVAFSEIRRILRRGGLTFHHFTSSTTPIELHTFVPFGQYIQSKSWLLLWAQLGIRKKYQKGMNPAEVAYRNSVTLRDKVHYIPEKLLYACFKKHFGLAQFREDLLTKYHSNRKQRQIFKLSRSFPSVLIIYRKLHTKFIAGFKKS
ncbi:MAG: hypothetical protein CVU57_11985 [Deltaproteobacteria bacterium HGW-Deltaproteobacteria-15]|jgi:SAM-dependent methyltransferase|nr:MAG: hypothetical protein CVU57_11985 [Deltaproteobacteria bacterium HGW-Deltaproteobacteria-15]